MTANSWESENVGVGERKDNANVLIPTGRKKKPTETKQAHISHPNLNTSTPGKSECMHHIVLHCAFSVQKVLPCSLGARNWRNDGECQIFLFKFQRRCLRTACG